MHPIIPRLLPSAFIALMVVGNKSLSEMFKYLNISVPERHIDAPVSGQDLTKAGIPEKDAKMCKQLPFDKNTYCWTTAGGGLFSYT